jgi:signal transduction histidine kinase/ligand-binding sensor domain-containing protein
MRTKMRTFTFYFYAVWVYLGALQDAHAQSNFLSQYTVQSWNTRSGLPADVILSTYQSSDGFLWMTGYSGLIRFDGITFTSFTSRDIPFLRSDNVIGIIEGADSTLWITTQNSGLLGYKNGVFRQYLADFNISDFRAVSRQGELVLSSANAEFPFVLFNPETLEHTVFSLESVDSALLAGAFTIPWQGVGDDGLWIINVSSVIRIANGQRQPISVQFENPGTASVFDLLVDSRNRVWLATSEGLFIWNGARFVPFAGFGSARFERYTAKAARLIMEDRNGGIWLGLESGIAHLPPGAETFEVTPADHPLRSLSITEIMEDREGNIWLSTLTGLVKLSRGKFTVFSKEEGFNNRTVNAAAALDPDRYLVATLTTGLYHVDQGVVTPYRFKRPELDAAIIFPYYMYADSRKNIWICGHNGAIRITEKDETIVGKGNRVRYVYEDRDGKLWFGVAYKGIAWLNDRDELEFLDIPEIDFSRVFLSSIRKLSDNNWLITTYNNGIILIGPDGRLLENEATRALGFATVFSSYEDENGVVWLPTSSGLYRLKEGAITHTGYADDMPELAVFNFLPDRHGFIWLPTNKGVLRAGKQEIEDYLDKKSERIHWQFYDEGDGMRSRACVGARHSTVSPDGKILVPTYDGLLEIDPDKMVVNELPPPVVIHNFSWNNERLPATEKQVLPPGNHRIVFEYSALSFTAPEKVKFRFKLAGYDRDWIEATGDRRAIYTNLPFGDYTFQVIACNNDGVWNEEGDVLNFTITPPWYRTWWAYALYLLVFGMLLFSVDRFQRRRVIRKERERAREKELAQAKEIRKAYEQLEETHANLKAAQSQLIQSEKMASLGELTAGIAHEIQNPLNFVNNFSEVNLELMEELKAQSSKLKGERYEALEEELWRDLQENEKKIKHHGQRASDIVKAMLQHSRSSNGQKELTDINALADEYLRLAYHGLRARDKSFNAAFKTAFDPQLPVVPVVPQDIGRVLLNLINNAFHAVDQRARQGQDEKYIPTVTVRTRAVDGKIEVRVADNGPGIPEHIREKIFQPFFTTKPTGEGTGLGLSLSYDIVTKGHGGRLEVDTTAGLGSEFIIQLPIV